MLESLGVGKYAKRDQKEIRVPTGRISTGLLMLLLLLPLTVLPAIKPRYGGSLKVAQELLSDMTAAPVFRNGNQLFLSPSITDDAASVDLSFLPADRISQIEQSVLALQNPTHPCHWILDYPYLDHQHPNTITVRDGLLVFKTREPEFLESLSGSSCMMTDAPPFLLSFRRTQYAYEANAESLTGRPFLDSVTPVAVDPTNPYLSFKLRDVDVFSVPEDRYRQIEEDPSLKILPGPKFFLYLKTENLNDEEVQVLFSAMTLDEIAGTVLNGHAQLLHKNPSHRDAPAGNGFHMRFDFPTEHPYRLVADRLRLQFEDAGIVSGTSGEAWLELKVKPVTEDDEDLIRYRILREDFRIISETAWFEIWDALEASGKIIPLLIYRSHIAVPKALADLGSKPGGAPDFSSCWFQPSP